MEAKPRELHSCLRGRQRREKNTQHTLGRNPNHPFITPQNRVREKKFPGGRFQFPFSFLPLGWAGSLGSYDERQTLLEGRRKEKQRMAVVAIVKAAAGGGGVLIARAIS